jgi:hypothetical protein
MDAMTIPAVETAAVSSPDPATMRAIAVRPGMPARQINTAHPSDVLLTASYGCACPGDKLP